MTFKLNSFKTSLKKLVLLAFVVGFGFTFSTPVTNAYPIFAQQNYENPREANGRIVCANCHLAQKPTEIEVPQAVLPNTVFEAVIEIPYDQQVKQVLANGKKGDLNVGMVLILPEGFELALLGLFRVTNIVKWLFLFFLLTQLQIKLFHT
jgi:hypothetical protein